MATETKTDVFPIRVPIRTAEIVQCPKLTKFLKWRNAHSITYALGELVLVLGGLITQT